MAAHAPSSLLGRLRQRADALPLDRAPLRRAGLLTVLLVALLVLGKVFSPAPARSADRQEVQSATEEVSAPQSSNAWTGGRVLAILLLLTGGGIAFWMHRRAGGRTVASGSTLKVIETHPLGPGQSLRLVACGEEVLLLSVASDGATLLRHWPRDTFEAEPVSFANALADLVSVDTSSTQPSSSPLPFGEDREAKASSQPKVAVRQQGEGLGASDDLPIPNSTPTRADEPTPFANSTEDAPSYPRMDSRLRGDDSIDGKEIVVDDLATPIPASPPGPVPVLARGTLFPARAHAPHQFDVRHG